MADQPAQPSPWVPDACTLPTAERPVRSAEFDAVFAGLLQEAAQLSPTQGRWTFTADAAQAAELAGLLERENSCCSFFTFELTRDTAGTVVVDVTVPAEHAPVLAALTQRATQLAAS
ncbi:MAG: hypothetical protein ABJB47_17665 [Actinomycetota bacterium]